MDLLKGAGVKMKMTSKLPKLPKWSKPKTRSKTAKKTPHSLQNSIRTKQGGTPYRWKGHDWRELSDKWGLDDGKLDDEEIFDRTTEYIQHAIGKYYDGQKDAMKAIAKDVRGYLRALTKCAKHCMYCWPLWEGLAKIRNDETLLRYVTILLGCMWS